MKHLLLQLGGIVAIASVVASPTIDRVIVGKWTVESPRRAPRIVFFHANHTWGVTNFDPDKPEEIKGRRWHIEGNKFVLTYPVVENGRQGLQTSVYTIISFGENRFATDALTYTRIK